MTSQSGKPGEVKSGGELIRKDSRDEVTAPSFKGVCCCPKFSNYSCQDIQPFPWIKAATVYFWITEPTWSWAPSSLLPNTMPPPGSLVVQSPGLVPCAGLAELSGGWKSHLHWNASLALVSFNLKPKWQLKQVFLVCVCSVSASYLFCMCFLSRSCFESADA